MTNALSILTVAPQMLLAQTQTVAFTVHVIPATKETDSTVQILMNVRHWNLAIKTRLALIAMAHIHAPVTSVTPAMASIVLTMMNVY